MDQGGRHRPAAADGGGTGSPLVVSPGKSFIAIWGGYYGQSLTLTGADGTAQTLPEKPALLESGVSDEAAAAAQAEFDAKQKIIDAQAAVDEANAQLTDAQTALEEAQAALEEDSENADLIAKRDEAQALVDSLNLRPSPDNQAILDAAGSPARPPPAPEEATSSSEVRRIKTANRPGIAGAGFVMLLFLFHIVQIARRHHVVGLGQMVPHPHLGVQPHAVAGTGVGSSTPPACGRAGRAGPACS